MLRTSSFAAIAAVLLLASTAGAQAVLEDFEAYSIGYGSAEVMNISNLDENAFVNGQGPNLVLDGCTYSAGAGTLQWNGPGWYGTATKNILSNSAGLLTLIYDTPVTSVQFDMTAYTGYSDVTVVTVYDGGMSPIYTSAPINVPDQNAVPFLYTAASIGKVTMQSSVYSWSVMIDNHKFGGGGVSLSKTGSCPGPVTLNATGCTAGGNVAILYGTAGSFTKNGNPCNGLTLGIANPTLAAMRTANGAGAASLSFNAPPGACGRTVQAVDVGSCTASNTILL